jgi:hypothetical protein
MPSPTRFCGSAGGRRPGGENPSARRNFHSDNSHLLLDGKRQQWFGKIEVARIGPFTGIRIVSKG